MTGIPIASLVGRIGTPAGGSILLPLDAVSLVTYGKGYYRMFDMFLPGTIISICRVIVITALLLLPGPTLGFL